MWSDCSKSFNCGHQIRKRTITQQANSAGEPCTGEPTQTRQCNTQSCHINCQWGQWGAWTKCSKSCNSGYETRQRTIAQQANASGEPCTGEPTQTQQCNAQSCPINCVWSQWSSWSECSKSCNSGHQIRQRIIAQQANSEGEPCTGEPSQTQQCNIQSCPINCIWGQWSFWSGCSKSYNTLANIHTSTSPRLSACHTDCHWHKRLNIKHGEVKGKC